MMRSAIKAIAGLAFLLIAACATGPEYAYKPWGATISEPTEIYPAWRWGKEIENGIIDAGRQGQVETIKAHYTEKSWPEKFASFNTRVENPDIIKQYHAEAIATFKNGEAPIVLLRLPAKDNKHMPDGWKPSEDIYVVIKQSGVAKQ